MPGMPPVPDLRVVPLETIRRHEEIDPFRVGRLMERIGSEGIQVNPMVCYQTADGTLVLLDGATRTEALKALGLVHGVIQVVDPAKVTLETWHHVVRDADPQRIVEEIRAREDLGLAPFDGPPRIHIADGGYSSVVSDGLSPNATLSALVDTYMGKWTVSRIVDPSMETVSWRFPDWSVIVEFPRLSIDDVVKAALGEDLLPAGITRFLVNDRALRVNIDLSLLSSEVSREEKQEALDRLLGERAHAGRIRRYEETVYVLDD
jgi:hypothetical protein